MLLSLLVITLFSGCSSCEPKVEYVDRPYEVKVPIKCEMSEVHCDFNKTTYTEVISSLIECIIEQKQTIEMCK
jgi:PBP1b-binding outer membrane lipoprotein LpoB